jgi:ABC-2 type transport system permease protein
MIRIIAARELKSLFLSPLAWAVLAVTQFLFAYMFLTQLEVYARAQPRLAGLESAPGVTEIVAAPLYSSAAVVLLLIAPLLTMRLIAEERRNDTLTLLLSAPISATEIVLGKFTGLISFFVLMIALLTLMPLSLNLGTSLDFGQLGACLLALLMLLAAFSALGLFISSLTAHPMVAGVSTFGALLLLWIIDWASTTGSEDKTGTLFNYLSMNHHYQLLLSGVFSSVDAGYFVLFTAMFLALTVWRVDADRLQG